MLLHCVNNMLVLYFIKPHKGDDNIWHFDTDVYQMEGIGRFSLGLSNHIRILHTSELEQYVATFVKGNLQPQTLY